MPVKVWFVRDGPEPTRGGHAYEVPLKTCIEKLGLNARQWLSPLGSTPKFGDQSPRMAGFSDYRYVVCEVSEADATAALKAGYYKLDLGPKGVVEHLGVPENAPKL